MSLEAVVHPLSNVSVSMENLTTQSIQSSAKQDEIGFE